MKIIEFADVLNVPILKAGRHHSRNDGTGKPGFVEITEEQLKRIIADSAECKDYIKESIKTGRYPNMANNPKRPIPGPLNLHHDDLLDETIKNRVKDVDWSFDTEKIDDDLWMTQSFYGVPSDIAKSLQTHFSGRSVELIEIDDQDKHYDMVVRSTAFLDRHTPPAVKGQTFDMTVEFSQADDPPIYVFYSEDTSINSNEEDVIMADKTDVKKTPDTPKADVSKEKDNKLKELQEALTKAENELEETKREGLTIKELQRAREEDAKQIKELQKARDAIELSGYMNTLSKGILTNENGLRYQTTPAFIELVEGVVRGIPRNDVIMLEDGKNQPARETIQDLLLKVVEFAMNDKIVVCLSEVAPQHFSDPAKAGQKRTRTMAVKEFQAEHPEMSYAEALKTVSNDPANADLFKIG